MIDLGWGLSSHCVKCAVLQAVLFPGSEYQNIVVCWPYFSFAASFAVSSDDCSSAVSTVRPTVDSIRLTHTFSTLLLKDWILLLTGKMRQVSLNGGLSSLLVAFEGLSVALFASHDSL